MKITHLSLRCQIFLGLIIFASPIYADITFLSDFETGAIQAKSDSHDGWGIQNCPSAGYEQHLVTGSIEGVSPRAGNYMLRTEIRYDDPWGYNGGNCLARARAELTKNGEQPNNGVMEFGKEYWIGVSIYLPSSFGIDNTAESFVQFIEEGYSSGGTPGGIGTREGQWQLYNSYRQPSGQLKISRIQSNHLNDYEKWVDWVFHVKWTDGNDGFFKVYKNGKFIGEVTGRTATGYGARKVYLKLGAYKAGWLRGPSMVKKRVIYHDEVRIWSGTGGSVAKVTSPEENNKVVLQPPTNLYSKE